MTTSLSPKEKVLGGLWGAIVGDALGVPVEFTKRPKLKENPVTDMREYGSHYQPRGTWSDDSSLMLCSTESLSKSGGFDAAHMGKLFVAWVNDKYWTAWNEVFDIGNATRKAIYKLKQGVDPEQAGGDSEDTDNGNGSLMRILPIALYFAKAPLSDLLSYAQRASSLTHRPLRSQMACGFYCAMAVALLEGATAEEAYQQTIEQVRPFYEQAPYQAQLAPFERIFSGKIGSYAEDDIKSGGYVIDTLEASIWCLLTTTSYKEAVLKAVNLGRDTDTTGIVTGGLAGIYYGLEGLPAEWIGYIARREDLTQLFEEFVSSLK
ncbi:MAG: ADP-ribosylglycohydrolase family protein [Chloroflexi bacterium]|nr:ADP-ribosylglycohydrolase family protein [Chloroflexota bacterium]